jgi:hypothetical protein
MTEWKADPTGSLVAMIAIDSGGVTGTVRAVFTRGDHVHVTVGTSGMDEPPALIYRGKSYAVALHLFAAYGWESEPGNNMLRPRVYDVKAQDAAPTFKTAILAAVTSAIGAFVAEHPEVPLLAEVNRAEREAKDTTAEVTKARDALHTAEVQHAVALTRLENALNALGNLS